MDLENELKGYRLRGSADGILRERILSAARWARRDRALWQRTWVAAALVLAICIPVNLSLERSHRMVVEDRIARQVREISAQVKEESLIPYLQIALAPKPQSHNWRQLLEEIP